MLAGQGQGCRAQDHPAPLFPRQPGGPSHAVARTLVKPCRQMLQDVILPGQLQVALHAGPLWVCLGVLVLRGIGVAGGQCEQRVGLVQEACKGRPDMRLARRPAVGSSAGPAPAPAHRSAAGSVGRHGSPACTSLAAPEARNEKLERGPDVPCPGPGVPTSPHRPHCPVPQTPRHGSPWAPGGTGPWRGGRGCAG